MRKIAARSCGSIAAQDRRAAWAASIAACTSALPASWQRASRCACRCGTRTSAIRPVRISRPPITSGISISRAESSASLAWSAARSGVPGA